MGSVTVPEVASTITRLVEFSDHLDDLHQNPSKELDAALLDHVYLQLDSGSGNTAPLLPLLLPRLASLLQVYAHDISPLARFTTKLIQDLGIGQIRAVLGQGGEGYLEPLIVAALSSPAPSANTLGLSLVKACAREGRDAIHRIMDADSLVDTFVHVWLCSPDAGVGAEATRTLLHLLSVDKRPDDGDLSGPPTMWDKLFSPAYQWTIYDRCMIQPADDKATRDQKTLAQARLLEALPCMVRLDPAMPVRSLPDTDWAILVAAGDNPHEPYPGEPKDGLVHLVALHMVDAEDIPMGTLVIRFWEQLVLSLDNAKVDPMETPGKDYARVLAVAISRAPEDSEKLPDALAALPARFEETEDQDRISNLLRALLFQATGHTITGAP